MAVQRKTTLVDEIETEALSGDVVKALRLSLKLGGEARSMSLREWASRELGGYGEAIEDVPPYRLVSGPLRIDGINFNTKITGQQFSRYSLPDFVQDSVPEEVTLLHPLPEIIDMAAGEDTIKLAPGMSAEILLAINAETDAYSQVTAIYWSVAGATIRGVEQAVRTILVELAAELRAGMAPDDPMPTSGLTEQAVGVAVHGNKNRITMQTASGTTNSLVSKAGAPMSSADRSWVKWLVAIATIGATVLGAIQIWGWPF